MDIASDLVPERGQLFMLEPIGLGTSDTESLSSYIARLAIIHNVSTYKLMLQEISPNIPYASDSYSSLNGMGDWTKEFLKGLEASTKLNNLRFMTMLPLHKAISAYNLCENNRKWCPECFNTWHEQGSALYEPLLWVFKEVEVCHIHKISLRKNCPTCDTTIPIFHARPNIGYCHECNGWLGLPDNNPKIPKENMEQKLYFANSIASLLGSLPGRSKPIHIKNIIQSLKKAIKKTAGGSTKFFCKKHDIPKASGSHWLNKKHLPSLRELLRLCFNLDIAFLDLIDNNIEQALKDRHPVKLERSKRGPQDPLPDLKEIEAQLKAILESDFGIPPIKTLATELKCQTKWLYREFNDLIKQITAKRKQQSKKKQMILLQEKQELIRKIVEQLVDDGIYPSARQVRKAANDEYILMDPKCYETWKKCKEQYLKKLNSPKKEKNNG